MLKFKQYIRLSESTKDVYSAIGQEKGDQLLKQPVDQKVHELHDKVFGNSNHHIEMPLSNPVPQKVIDHVHQQGDSMEGERVRLKSGRHVELSKYLPRSKAPKPIIDDHENWARNKGTSNTKLVISRHPGEVASCSTGTHWDSCSNLGGSGPAASAMPHEIKHGTLIAMHVHAHSKPDEHGEYAAKDVLGRTLIKRHDADSGGLSYHQEGRSYGAFPHVAKEAVDRFTEQHYPLKDNIATKHVDLYDDDSRPVKIGSHVPSDFMHKALVGKDVKLTKAVLAHKGITPEHITAAMKNENPTIRGIAIRHPAATAEHINATLDSDGSADVRYYAIKNPNATPEHISTALKDSSDDVRVAAVSHPAATPEHISAGMKDSAADVRYYAIKNPNTTAAHISTALKDSSDYVRSAAAKHPNATPEHISSGLKDESARVRIAAAKHPAATAEHITTGLKDSSDYVRAAAVSHPAATAEHISTGLKDVSVSVRITAAKHPNAKEHHISTALQDEYDYVRWNAIKNPNATPEHISTALKDSSDDVRVAAVSHPAATPEHISTALKDSSAAVRNAAKDK